MIGKILTNVFELKEKRDRFNLIRHLFADIEFTATPHIDKRCAGQRFGFSE